MRLDTHMNPKEAALWWKRQGEVERLMYREHSSHQGEQYVNARARIHTGHHEGRGSPRPDRREWYLQGHLIDEVAGRVR
jgi:hypothetical protein